VRFRTTVNVAANVGPQEMAGSIFCRGEEEITRFHDPLVLDEFMGNLLEC
jgi:hypothetical protein